MTVKNLIRVILKMDWEALIILSEITGAQAQNLAQVQNTVLVEAAKVAIAIRVLIEEQAIDCKETTVTRECLKIIARDFFYSL